MTKTRTKALTEKESAVHELCESLFPPSTGPILPLPCGVSSVRVAERSLAHGVAPVLMRGGRILRFYAAEQAPGKRRRGFSFDIFASDAVPCGHQEDVYIAHVLSDAMAVFGYCVKDGGKLPTWTPMLKNNVAD